MERSRTSHSFAALWLHSGFSELKPIFFVLGPHDLELRPALWIRVSDESRFDACFRASREGFPAACKAEAIGPPTTLAYGLL